METAFIIYIRAVGLYVGLTFPAMVLPIIYVISLLYVVIYGWFAWALFTVLYLIIEKLATSAIARLSLLALAVPVAVIFAFQMIEVFKSEKNIWQSGPFLLFPLAGTICGWISLSISAKKIVNQTEQLRPVNNKEL